MNGGSWILIEGDQAEIGGYLARVVDDFEVAGGLYWGIGVGGEIKNIVLEFIYGCNYATIKASNYRDMDLTYTAFRINVGYKFEL